MRIVRRAFEVFYREHFSTDELRRVSLQARQAFSDPIEARSARHLVELGFGQDVKMLALAEDEILEASTEARSLLGKIGEPGAVAVDEFMHRGVAVGAAHAKNPVGFETAVHLPEVEAQVG